MTPRELNNELQRLKQMAKSLLSGIEALQTRVDVASDGHSEPPQARPTTKIRRVTAKSTASGSMPASDDEPPSTRPGAGSGGTYRHVAKKR